MTGIRETIVALSSGAVPSGVAVIRVSGPQTRLLLERHVNSVPQARRMVLKSVMSATGAELDTGLVVFFPGPNSFTGEDCAEFQLHGSRAVVSAVLSELCRNDGVRLAEAGDFTRRAFEAGRLDLTQVEGLDDLIASETETQRQLALKRSQGELRETVAGWRRRLIDLRAEVEARLDFSDEGDVEEHLPAGFAEDIGALVQELAAALAGFEGGRIVRDGFRVVLAGAPNAGKSSLLNALAGSEEAIVTSEAGTTRDVKEVQLDLDGHLVRMIDVAGLRQTESIAEAEGVRRAETEIAKADLVLWLVAPDVADAPRPEFSGEVWRIQTKADLGLLADQPVDAAISCKTGEGVDMLKAALRDKVSSAVSGETSLISRLRDKESVELALGFLAKARSGAVSDELLAEDLRLSAQALMRLTGEIDAEQVLDRLFAGFCIGK